MNGYPPRKASLYIGLSIDLEAVQKIVGALLSGRSSSIELHISQRELDGDDS